VIYSLENFLTQNYVSIATSMMLQRIDNPSKFASSHLGTELSDAYTSVPKKIPNRRKTIIIT